MGVSIYYTVRRSTPLTEQERRSIAEIVTEFSVEEQIERYVQDGRGPNWESFYIYDPNQPSEKDVIFEGATRLPDNSDDASLEGLRHWCRALTKIRLALPNSSWLVHVDDQRISWDPGKRCFDPLQS